MEHSQLVARDYTTVGTIADRGRTPRLRAALAIAAVIVALLTGGAMPASAGSSIDLLCGPSNFSISFNPPLTTATVGQLFTGVVTSNLVSCLSPNGQHSDLTSGQLYDGVATGILDACIVAVPTFSSSGTGTWRWNPSPQAMFSNFAKLPYLT